MKKRKDGLVAEETYIALENEFLSLYLPRKKIVRYSFGGKEAKTFSQVSINCEHLIFLEI